MVAEIERDDMDEAVRRVIDRDYTVEERLALQVRIKDRDEQVIYETWALNEATVEKASRERMLEVVIEIDGRPLSSFGCDGIVVSTPTGSTAYNFSAGGPVIWPGVEAIAVVRHHGLQSYLTAATNPNPDRHVEKVGTHLVVTGSRAATPNRSGATWPIWRGSFVVDRGSGRAVP